MSIINRDAIVEALQNETTVIEKVAVKEVKYPRSENLFVDFGLSSPDTITTYTVTFTVVEYDEDDTPKGSEPDVNT